MVKSIKAGDWLIFNTSYGGYIIDHITCMENGYLTYGRYCCHILEEGDDPSQEFFFRGGSANFEEVEEYMIFAYFCDPITEKEAVAKISAEKGLPQDIINCLAIEPLMVVKEGRTK